MRLRTIQRTLIFAFALGLLAAVFSVSHGSAAAESLSVQEARGKQIFQNGEGGPQNEITAVIGASGSEMPATAFPCANCHGLTGEGTKEGGLQPPPVTWRALTTPHRSDLTGHNRSPYDETTVARAIREGWDASGQPLHPGMPHFKLTLEQMADLISYLKVLGNANDVDPGVSATAIKIGAALPLSGPLTSAGEDMKAVLEAYFATVNEQGGIYGRQIQLVVRDSQGNPKQTLEATRRLVETEDVFALAGSFQPLGSEATYEYLQRKAVPLVGPITLSPPLSTVPNRFVFYLMPAFKDQARVLVDYVQHRDKKIAKSRPVRLAVVYANRQLEADAVEGLKSQARLHSLEIVAEETYPLGHFAAEETVAKLKAKNPGDVFFFGASADIIALAHEMDRQQLRAALLSSVEMLGQGPFHLSNAVAARIFLAYPSTLPDPESFADFISVLKKGGVRLRNSGFQRTAYAAGRVFVEGAKQSGRQISRRGLISALEQLDNFSTGIAPPVSFGPNRRVGAIGSCIVGIDAAKGQFIPLSRWLVPEESN